MGNLLIYYAFHNFIIVRILTNGITISEWCQEEITIIKEDFLSFIPLAVIAVKLLKDPKSANNLSQKAISNYSLTADTVKIIEI